MLPWLGPWGTGQEEATEGLDLSTGSDQGEAWSSGEETMEKQQTPVQDSSQPQALSPSETERKQLLPFRHLATELTAEAPVPLSPWRTYQVTPSRMTPLPLWDPSHQANTGPQLLGASCGSGISLSNRTLCHPSWPMYDDWGRMPTTSGHPEEKQVASRGTGLPVRNSEEVFLLDPLLSPGQRVPLYLPKPPQQAMGSLKLLLPPPIMSSSVQPSSSQARPPTWLSEAEMIALAGLLQMSQGEQTPDSQASSLPSASCPDPAYVSEDPGPNGGQSCSGSTDPR
uniref:Sin3A-associated protein 25 n=1 Tax=Rattus norvegicus TaxID=10116 RepID=A0ABK0LXY6_RAT